MYYRNELFYRLHTVDIANRARLYHYACRLSQQSAVVVTASDERCSIWVSLRSPNVSTIDLDTRMPPPFLEHHANGTEHLSN